MNHLERALPDPRNTVLFVGYQAAGTRGRSLIEGAKQIKMRGVYVPVSAQIDRIDSMSAHADGGEILRWLRGFSKPPGLTCIVHGELPAMQALEADIHRELGSGWRTHVPEYLESMDL